MLERVDVILHRPQSSENVGAVARAMKNFGLAHLVLVAPARFDRVRAGVLAVHAGDVLDGARIVTSLEDAISPDSMVIPTTERALEGRPAPLSPRQAVRALVARLGASSDTRVALLFGAESSGIRNSVLGRFQHYSSIPADPGRRSLNLAQAVLLYAWELQQEAGATPPLVRPDPLRGKDSPAPHLLRDLLRKQARALFLANGFLNPQQPDERLDELMRLLERAQPSHRELELLLAAMAQLERTSTVRES